MLEFFFLKIDQDKFFVTKIDGSKLAIEHDQF